MLWTSHKKYAVLLRAMFYGLTVLLCAMYYGPTLTCLVILSSEAMYLTSSLICFISGRGWLFGLVDKVATSFIVVLAVTGGSGGGEMRLLAFTSDTVVTVTK